MPETLSAMPVVQPPRRGGCLKWGCASLLVLVLGSGVLVWRMVDKGFDFARFGLDWVAGLPARLTSAKITETFRQEISRITSTDGDVLELAMMETSETMTKADSLSLFNDLLYLGTTESEIRVPVVYRFHLKLSDDWNLKLQDGRCIVIAPPIRPTLPPAIRTEGMEKKTEAGWLRFNAQENLAKLESDLTPMLESRAGAHAKIPGVRDNCRRSVAKFVQKWLMRETSGGDAIKDIVVIFPDEPEANNAAGAAAGMTGKQVQDDPAH